MKCESPAFASVSSREPAPIQKPIETERTCASRSEMTRSPESSSVSTYFCCTRGSYSWAQLGSSGGAGGELRGFGRGGDRRLAPRPTVGDVERRDRGRGRAAGGSAVAWALRRHPPHRPLELLLRRRAGQDLDLPGSARAALRP